MTRRGGGGEVGEAVEDLGGDRPRLALRQAPPVRLEVGLQVPARAVLQHGGERVVVDLKHVHQPHDARVGQVAVDGVLPHGVADVGGLAVGGPAGGHLVQLDRDGRAAAVEVCGGEHLREAAPAQQAAEHVAPR